MKVGIYIEHQKVTAIMAIDLSAAFDTVDHEILKWFNNHLQTRSFFVNIGKTYFDKTPLDVSVHRVVVLAQFSNYENTMKYTVTAVA